MKKLITIIAPMYNEENLVEKYCETVLKDLNELKQKYRLEILLINDGSKDKTYEIMNKMHEKYNSHVSIINLSRNFGLEGAINAGLLKSKGDVVVIMDADLQDPPSVINEMIKKYENGYDVVVAKRRKRKSDTIFKKLSASLYYKITDILSGKLKLERNAANFRLLSKIVVKELLKLEEVNKIFRVSVPFIGMKTIVIEYDRDKRFSGKTKYNLISMLKYALDGITSVSVEPLRKIFVIFIFNIFITLLFFFLFITSLEWNFIYFICFIMSFLSGLILVSLALIAEYVAQIMIETKRRPTSIIYEYKSFESNEKEE